VNQERPLERTFLLQDMAVVVLALGLAGLIRQQVAGAWPGFKPTVPRREYIHLFLVYLPTWALGAQRLDLHRVRTLTGPLVDLLRHLMWSQGWGLLAIALILVGAQVPLNRSLIASFLVVSTLLLFGVVLWQRSWLLRHDGQALALLVGADGDMHPEEIEQLRGRRVERLEGVESHDLRRRLQAGGVDEVVLAGGLDRARLRGLLEACAEVGVPALVALDRIEVGLVPPRAEVMGRNIYLTYQAQEPDLPSRFVKAAFDRTAGALALVLTLPLMLLVAVLIKVIEGGPVLFVQPRGGLNGRPFRMLKFRTMRVGAEVEREALAAANEMDGPVFKIAEDPRVTRIGRVLRRTSIDELPQLVNVVAGHMSLVGPRPLPVIETRELTGMHRRRLSMRPGITCLWQVSGRNELGFAEWMALDLQYVDNWSLGLDLAILLRTLPALVTGRGAS
jgi:exopolysaccharide biosynthesis polyprenyl glycosylphosphotransferase